jgi:BMFP domain-containing protein YqiC
LIVALEEKLFAFDPLGPYKEVLAGLLSAPEYEMQTQNPFLDEMAKLSTAAVGLAQAAGEEAKAAFRAQADRMAAEFDLIRRDDFEALKAEVAALRAEVEALRGAAKAAPEAAAKPAAASKSAPKSSGAKPKSGATA